MQKKLVGLVCLLVTLVVVARLASAQDTLTFEAEDWTTPKDAWEKDKHPADKWSLWSTDSNAKSKWSGGVVLQSPPVMKDRERPEDGAPPLHTHITGIQPGKYEIEIKMGRALAISRDGTKWEKIEKGYLGIFDITDGTFDLWVDDRYACESSPGSS